jgi:hypothetical protein
MAANVPVGLRIVVLPPGVAADAGAVADAREGEIGVVLHRGRARKREAAELAGDHRQRHGQQQHDAKANADTRAHHMRIMGFSPVERLRGD